MIPVIVLDSGPLALLVYPPGLPETDACTAWLASHQARGCRIVLPEIVDYELRRELLRLNKGRSLKVLDSLVAPAAGWLAPLSTGALRLAAQLWADARARGIPTAAPQELDVDVILCAQALTLGVAPADLTVATTNPVHISRFVPADLWRNV
jgi:hypothetical protein